MQLTDGFDFHLTLRTDITILPVSLPSLLSTVSASLLPALATAYDTAPDPARVKAFLFTNPHNPLGQCYPKGVIQEAIRWCGRKGIHFVGDEVYGLSEFRQGVGEDRFVSALSSVGERDKKTDQGKMNTDHDDEIYRSGNRGFSRDRCEKMNSSRGINDMAMMWNEKEDREELQNSKDHAEEREFVISHVHVVWSLSKDLGSSGLRIVCHSPFPFSIFPFLSPQISSSTPANPLFNPYYSAPTSISAN